MITFYEIYSSNDLTRFCQKRGFLLTSQFDKTATKSFCNVRLTGNERENFVKESLTIKK